MKSRKTGLAACLLAVAAIRAESAAEVLENEKIRAEFDRNGLAALHDKQLGRTLQFAGDHWSFIIEHRLVDSSTLTPKQRVAEPHAMRYVFREGPFTVEAVYELKPTWRFVAKQLFVTNAKEDVYTVRHVNVFHGHLDNPARHVHVANLGEKMKRARQLGDFGAFVRLDGWGGFFLTQNPFAQWRFGGGDFSMDYRADMTWKTQYGPFISDRACVGTYELTGRRSPGALSHRASWLMQPEWSLDAEWIDSGEIDAFIDCVREFLLYRPTKSVRVHIPWCENDYQIDVSTDDGAAQFKRIVDTASALGVQHMLYTVRNDQIARQEDASDAWRWEHLLWLNMGIQIRRNQWDPRKDPLPERTRELMDYARSKNIRLMAYVYPTVAFEQNPEWLTRRHPSQDSLAANPGFRSFQDWLIENLVGFMENTGVSGYAFDYWGLKYPGASVYSQWFGARRVLEELRRRAPEIVIDGRQSYHGYGPWTWLGGSYPHPTGGDEQPESFEPFPDLHFDRSSAAQQRLTSYWYRNIQFCPTELTPGFIGHQTARKNADGEVIYNTDFNIRDWDLLGWKVSLLSSVATAPFAHCLDMIPARDPQEFELFSKDVESRQFMRRWFDWTDRNAEILRSLRTITGPPAIGRTDGTAAVEGDHGFVFLFNPNHRRVAAEFRLDESIGLTSGDRFLLRQLYPEAGKLLGAPGKALFQYGDRCSFLMDGTSAWVLELQPFRESSTPLLFNARGKARLENGKLDLRRVAGEVGAAVEAQALLPEGQRVSEATVNGRPVPFVQKGRIVEAPLRFAGQLFRHNQAVSPYDPSFSGSRTAAAFHVPRRIFDQLKARRERWPIPWTKEDLRCTWLAPERLLLYIQIAEPDWRMEATLRLDGSPVEVKKAYSSRTPGRLKEGKGHNTFTGFYADFSDLTPDRTYHLEATLPESLKPGQFQGLFFENVETEYTSELASP